MFMYMVGKDGCEHDEGWTDPSDGQHQLKSRIGNSYKVPWLVICRVVRKYTRLQNFAASEQ
jgi:hypothetical protein